MSLPPLRFDPLLKPRAWGGLGLERFGRQVQKGAKVGESWDLADLPPEIPEGVSIVAEGPLAGRRLADLRDSEARALLGRLEPAATGGFPILIKLLDAQDNLSVQVHPDPRYAAEHPNAYVKNEAWYVLDAAPGAVVYRGLDPAVDAASFRRHIEEERVLADLVRIPVKRGDCVRLPSGICHALGAGVVVAEVQTPSDTTFRVWDWDRNDPARPLHLEPAMACMRFGAAQEDGRPAVVETESAPAVTHGGCRFGRVCLTDDFTIDRFESEGATTIPLPNRERPLILIGIRGSARVVDGPGRTARLDLGDTVLIPADHADAQLEASPGAELLWVELGAPSSS